MIKHITNINNIGGTASLAQENVTKIAHSLNMREIGLFRYADWTDTDTELSRRMDGIIASLHHGDFVIFQYPSWNHMRYDSAFITHVKTFSNIKLVIWVEDVESIMFNLGLPALSREISLFNRADMLILPSKGMHDILKENGLTQTNVLYQTIWDHCTDTVYYEHDKRRQFIFTGNYSRFPFLADYHGKTPMHIYSYEQPERPNDASFEWKGGKTPTELLYTLSKGGFGLVWADDEYFNRYYSINQPHKLGYNLAAGIPVIVRRGCVHEEFVKSHNIGFVVESLEEADSIVQNITDAEYDQLYDNIRDIQYLLTSGAYTTKLLHDATVKMFDPQA